MVSFSSVMVCFLNIYLRTINLAKIEICSGEVMVTLAVA